MIIPSYARASKKNIDKVPRIDGQLIFSKDTGELHYDVGNKRYKITDYVEVDTALRLEGFGIQGKLYYVKDENSFYTYNDLTHKFNKVINVTASEVQFNSDDMLAKDVDAAIKELKVLDNEKITIENATVGDDGKVVQAITINGDDNGIAITQVKLSLEDGSTITSSIQISLKDMGTVSENEFNEYKTATATSTDARNQEVDNALNARVEKTKIGSEVVKSVEHTGIAAGGIITKTTKVDPSTGESAVETAELTAEQLGVATAKQATDLQAQIDTIRGGLLRYEVDFNEVFGTATPTKTDVDGYFTGLHVIPYVGTAIINNNHNQSTYKHVFTYYVDETVDPVVDPDTGEVTYTLKLVDDGPDNIATASEDTLGGVRGAGDISVDTDGNMHIKPSTVNKNELGEDVTSELADAVKKSESKSLCDGIEVIGTGDGIKAATNFTEYAGAASLPDKQKSKNWAVSLEDMGAFSKEAANNKLDKVPGAVENHVAVFDANGNIIDAGEGIPDLEPKMDKVKTATEGHIAVFDANGNVIDSGKTFDDITIKCIDYDELLS